MVRVTIAALVSFLKGENKMVTVKVREIRFDPGFCGSKPQGTVTVSANIQSDDLGRLEIGVQVLNQGSEELNIQ